MDLIHFYGSPQVTALFETLLDNKRLADSGGGHVNLDKGLVLQ